MTDGIDTVSTGGSNAGGAGLGWKPIAVVFIVVSMALGGLLAYDQFMAEGPELHEIEATVKILHGGTVVDTQTITTGNSTPLGVLEEAVGYDNINLTYYAGMGYLVNSINGIGNGADVAGIDDTSNYYWQYYVNDELGPVSADRFALQDGDVLEWRFEEMIW